MVAAPIPCKARKATRLPVLQASPQPVDASPNNNSPNWKTRREPSLSLIPPADSMNAAKATVYASAIHCSELISAEKALAMLGRAILTMDTSSWDTTKARLVVVTIYPKERSFAEWLLTVNADLL